MQGPPEARAQKHISPPSFCFSASLWLPLLAGLLGGSGWTGATFLPSAEPQENHLELVQLS